MIYGFLKFCFWAYIIGLLVLLAFTGYAYRVNARRKADDPQKKDYSPVAVPMVIAWPIYVLTWTALFILKALAYGIFLIVFTVALVVIRKPFIFKLFDKVATKIGTMFLKANTFLIRSFFPKANPEPA